MALEASPPGHEVFDSVILSDGYRANGSEPR